MLGINLMFAGFAMCMNALSDKLKLNKKFQGYAVLLIGGIIAFDAMLQTIYAKDISGFDHAASMWLFALNNFLLGPHILTKAENKKVYGLFMMFATIMTAVFAGQVLATNGEMILFFMWLAWGILWLVGSLSILFEIKFFEKIEPYLLFIVGAVATFLPGVLILLGIILKHMQ